MQMFLIRKVSRCIEAGEIVGSPREIALVMVGLAQGLAAQERTGLLGPSQKGQQRWNLAFEALLRGFEAR